MKQAILPLSLNVKKTRKAEFLEHMERVVPWAELVALIAPYYPEGKNGRPPFPLETMLRTHFLQLWFTLSDPAMEEAFFGVPLYRALHSCPSSPGCLMSPPSCASATGWRNTNWPSRCWAWSTAF